MSHSAKHRSSFYNPFRDAADCAPQFGDRKTYQVPFTNPREAMREIESDIAEGVDIVMVKPALAYLALIAEAKRNHNPVSAYSVSGEYALVKGAAQLGWINETDIMSEHFGFYQKGRGRHDSYLFCQKDGSQSKQMRDDERFEIERAYDLLPHVIGASLSCVWFRTNNIKKPSEDEFRKKTVEFFSILSNMESSYPDEEKFSDIRSYMKNRYNQ